MAESTHLRDHAIAESTPRKEAPARGGAGRKIRRALANVFFWPYERGTLQYDLIVLAILAFIFATPRSWFDDRPTLQLTDLRRHQGIVEVSRSAEGGRYLVDARLVESMAPRKLEDAVNEILGARVQKPFVINSIDPLADRNNVLLGFTVVITFK